MKRSQVVPSMKRPRLYHQCESEKNTLLNGSADFSFERCGLSFDVIYSKFNEFEPCLKSAKTG